MTNTIKLQGISGKQEGTATKNLKIGDVIIWNYGMKSEVVEIMPSKTGKTITFMLKSCQDGETRSRKMGAERLVVVERKQQEEPENKVEKAMQNREQTYNGIYSDIGVVLDQFSIDELTKFYIEKYGESSIRYYLEQQIIAGEISKEKSKIILEMEESQ